MALSPARAQPFASPKRKRTHEDSSPDGPQKSPCKPRHTHSFQTYPLLLAQQAANDVLPATSHSQISVTGKFENLAIRNATRNESPPMHHGRKRLTATSIDSPNPSTSLLGQFQLSESESRHEMHPPSTASFDFEAEAPLAVVRDLPRRQSRSPPLDGEPQDNFWHDSEITGHNPTDPGDDGYGINGIGFRPTPAIAWARSQKRKQQLADYKSRETKEARQRRIERRRVSSNVGSEKDIEDAQSPQKSTKVRFEDG